MKSVKSARWIIGFASFKSTFITPASRVLTRSEKKKLISVTIVQVALGFLDLIGIALVGILGALAVVGVQSRDPGNRVNSVLTGGPARKVDDTQWQQIKKHRGKKKKSKKKKS